ncbi:MAG TPA: tyrosine-type recombinase/integrase [Acidobacteriota bacterium]|nr:tyrosine-type recombinase/integrase [Acidobacteriota bacterium]
MASNRSKLHQICADFLHHLSATKNLSRHTHRAYETDLRDFLTFVGGHKTLEVCTRELLQSYMHHLQHERELKTSTVKRRLACLRQLFLWLEDEERIEVTPFQRLRVRLRLPHRLPRTLTRREVRALILESAKRLGIYRNKRYTPQNLPLHPDPDALQQLTTLVCIELLFSTGIRVGELVAIRLRDLDIDTSTILIQGKGHRQRHVFLPDDTLHALISRYLQIRSSLHPTTSQLILHPSLDRLTTTAHVRRWIAEAGRQASLTRRITPHMFRHTAATHLLEAGLDIRYVQRLLGHQSLTTTQIYTAVDSSHLRSLVRKYNCRGTLRRH